METNGDEENDLLPPIDYFAEELGGRCISEEFYKAYNATVPVEYLHQLMLDLGHTPVYDPETTDPYWMTEVEEESPHENENDVVASHECEVTK